MSDRRSEHMVNHPVKHRKQEKIGSEKLTQYGNFVKGSLKVKPLESSDKQ